MATQTGKAMVWTAIGAPLEPREYPLPEVAPDAILVKIRMACICGSDVHSYKGEYVGRLKPSKEQPLIMGHEMSGTVYKLGRDVTADYLGQPLKEGDRIIYSYFNPCGKCWACLSGKSPCPNKHRFRKTSAEPPHFRGAFAEYYYLRGDQWVFKVPDALPDETVTPINCAMSTVTYGMHQIRIPLGGTVAIQGAGGLGLSTIAVAREMGAARIIVLDKLASRLALARRFGADDAIDLEQYPTPEARLERVRALTQGKGVDVAVEVVGRPEVVQEGLEMLCPGGSYLTMGLVTGGMFSQVDMERVVHKGLTIVGSGNYQAWVLPKVLDMLVRTKDKYPFHQLVSHKFRLDDINEGLKQSIEGKVVRAGVVPG
ncbi:MAG: zinc-binding dehydrogenase [Burkholderiales bacterium]|nr:zinc-binding dehydrogenase [Burkholderiales bacterium]